MRIAFVGGRGLGSNYGGVEHAIREIATRLASENAFDVDVYGRGEQTGFSIHEAAPGLFRVGAPRWLSRFEGNAMLALFCCFHSLLFRRPQVMLLFASGPSLLAIFARLLRVKVITALRSIDSQRDKFGWVSVVVLRMGERSALSVADECTVNSLEMYRHFDGIERGLHYIPNGASASDKGSDSVLAHYGLITERYVLFAARLDEAKRLHVLLEAYGRLPEDKRLPLVIAGGECRNPQYESRLREQNCTGVHFIGHVDRNVLDPLMRNCAMFVLPSIREGMSNSLLAAMYAGRCVLCSDIESNRDVVQRPEALFRVDDVTDLAEKLQYYCSNALARQQCGQQLQQIAAQQFCWDTTACSYRDLILATCGMATRVADT